MAGVERSARCTALGVVVVVVVLLLLLLLLVFISSSARISGVTVLMGFLRM